MLQDHELKPLEDSKRQAAADQSFVDAANKLCQGLEELLVKYAQSDNAQKKKLAAMWNK
jgi:hypothetical protein